MNADIRLFHGTSKKHLDSILEEDYNQEELIHPTGKTSHQHTDRIYLTRSLITIFFAIKSAYLTNTDPVIIGSRCP